MTEQNIFNIPIDSQQLPEVPMSDPSGRCVQELQMISQREGENEINGYLCLALSFLSNGLIRCRISAAGSCPIKSYEPETKRQVDLR